MVIQRPDLTPAACSTCCGDVEPDVSGSHSICTHCGDERVTRDRLEPRFQAPVFSAGIRPAAMTAPGGRRRACEGSLHSRWQPLERTTT
jgi:predicted RNA-binding Zn-ribbon protein involved in translation (DUF1610 family)